MKKNYTIYILLTACIAALSLLTVPEASAQRARSASEKASAQTGRASLYRPSEYRLQREAENSLIDVADHISSGRYTQAAPILDSLLAIHPDNAAAHYYRAVCYMFSREAKAAETHFKKAVELDPSCFWYRNTLANFYSYTGSRELTIEILNGLLEDFPKKNDLYYSLIDTYLNMGRMEEALETLDKIETVFGKSDISAMTRFDILRTIGRQREAFESLEAYNKEYSSPEVLTILGDYQMSMYNDSTALAYYDEALSLASDYAPAMLGKAETYRLTRRYDNYFSTMNVFVASKDIPVGGKCSYLEAVIRQSDANFLDSFQPRFDTLITTCLDVYPKDSSVTSLAGIYYYSTGREDLSTKYFKQNVDNWPSSFAAASNYAEVLLYTQKWPELASFSTASFENFPGELSFLEMASAAYYSMDEWDNVISVCEKIVSSSTDTSQLVSAISTIGDMYHKKGENARAYSTYERALKLDGNYLPLLNNYAYFLSLDGKKLKKAAAMSKKTVEAEPDNPTYLDTYAWILYLQGKPGEAKPYFKHAMLYGGKDSAVILDHYAEVLYALGEYDLAFVYWGQALSKDADGDIEGLQQKIDARKAARKK